MRLTGWMLDAQRWFPPLRGASRSNPPFHQANKTHQCSGYARITDEEAAIGRARDPHKGRHPRRTNGVADVRRLRGLSSRSGGGANGLLSAMRSAGVFLICLSFSSGRGSRNDGEGGGGSRVWARRWGGRRSWMLVAAFAVGGLGVVVCGASRRGCTRCRPGCRGVARRGHGYVGLCWGGTGTGRGSAEGRSRWARRRWS